MKSILPFHLNVAETVRKKEDKYFGPESRTTTSEHPAHFSSYLNLQPPSEKYFHPTGKSPITF